MKILIVGGVAGGASAAARARRLAENAEIVVFERGPNVSFANCGLPYFIGGKITDRDKLLVVTPELLKSRLNLDVRVRSSVESIDRDEKRILVRELDTGREYWESYDKLILAPGASPLRPPIPGIDLPRVHTLRNLQDMDRIKEVIDRGISSAVVIGAGFIGLELVENLAARGVPTTLIELQEQVLPPLDQEMATPLAQALLDHGVQLMLGDAAEAFREDAEGQLVVQLRSGREVPADLVALGIGVQPESRLAAESGLELGPRGAVLVNQHLQTSDPDVYAVGDVIQVRDSVLGADAHIPLAGPANRQGRLAADHIFGRETCYRGTQGTAVLGLFGVTAAMTGASEKTLRRAGRPYRMIYIHPSDHAGYYPGAEPMTLKVLFDPESGKLLGAQGVGRAGVDKRIDVLSVALQAGMTVYDLEEVELAYAPQFGSAKDPVNMIGFVASGLLRGDHPQIDVARLSEVMNTAGNKSEMELSTEVEQTPFLVDVRTAKEYGNGHIPNATNIPIEELRGRLHELPAGQALVVYCQVGMRGYLATRVLMQSGFRVENLSGGYKTYQLWQWNRKPEA
ncbi:MAG: FAD-dependent oxidoreductase [Planctomycetales bacterium]|nr:FAD-dependent oxidoreductase [Planctomycetales bacterium]